MAAKARQLAGEPLRFFELAQLLVELHETQPSAFSGLVDTNHIGRRRIYYMLRVGELIRDEHLSREQAEHIGWTKLHIIARHLDSSDEVPLAPFSELAELADKHTARDLPLALSGVRVISKGVVQFYLNLGARAELNETLIKFGAKQSGKRLKGKEAALIRMVRAASRI